jgi:hypothetical protein
MHFLGQTAGRMFSAIVTPLAQSDDFRESVEAFHGKRKAKVRGS